MARLYKSYCYPTLNNVVDNIRSEGFIEGLGFIDSVNIITGGKVQVDYKDSSQILYTQVLTFPVCQDLGFSSSYTGLTTADSVEIGGYMVLALVFSYALKILRRAL